MTDLDPLPYRYALVPFIKLLDECAMAFEIGIKRAVDILGVNAVMGFPIMTCGNGGSAADAEHMVAELVGAYRVRDRDPINAICLNSNSAVMTAWANDVGYEAVFARQLKAHGRSGVLVCFSTSGDSDNVVRAADMAQKLNMPTISFTGETGGRLANRSQILFNVPSRDTPMIQQVHQTIYHYLCGRVEDAFVASRT